MKFREKLEKNKFVFTLEVEPPKGVDIESTLKEVLPLKKYIDAFNVTDMQSANMRLSSWALAAKLKLNNLEPILQLTTRDRNCLALQGDLLGSYALGVENLLLLTGDRPICGDHPKAKEVFEVDSLGLIKIASQLNSGYDLSGNLLKGKPNFYIGAALNPMAKDVDRELKRAEKKIKLGASFFQTQPIFDVKKFYVFMKKIRRLRTKVIAGVIFLKSHKMAKYLNENVEGIEVPHLYIDRLEKAKNKKEEAIRIAKEIIAELKDICQGVHIMSLGWYSTARELFL
ncbi:MAG: methylenetetrahydrofolate reductase [Candidatus Omnitrophica bacterium]|nr:methylenetetrahydrofolate reductase [Candidatus Omnitrophota bacterium]